MKYPSPQHKDFSWRNTGTAQYERRSSMEELQHKVLGARVQDDCRTINHSLTVSKELGKNYFTG